MLLVPARRGFIGVDAFSPLFIGARNVTDQFITLVEYSDFFQSPFHRGKECYPEVFGAINYALKTFSPLFIGARNVTTR